MARKALLVGCNYPGTMVELKGCINDVKRMHRCLVERYGFSKDDITVLIDVDDSYVQPTSKNIRRALADLVRSAEPGDFLFVHFSGHGTCLPAEMGEGDDTGYHKCIVPCDMKFITDKDFREFVNQVPEGCRLTIVSDSCYSGGLMEQAKEQIGERGILISSCQTDQTSADAWPSGNAHEAYGTFSNAILTLITATDGAITNYDLVKRAGEMLESQGFTQRPGLYCSDHHVDAPFIC